MRRPCVFLAKYSTLQTTCNREPTLTTNSTPNSVSDSKRTLDWAKANARSWWIQTSTLAQIKSALRLWSNTVAGLKVNTHHITPSPPPLSPALSRPSMQRKGRRKKANNSGVTRSSLMANLIVRPWRKEESLFYFITLAMFASDLCAVRHTPIHAHTYPHSKTTIIVNDGE